MMRKEILELLTEVIPNVDFSSSTALIDDGILDSFAVLTVVSALSDKFGIIFDTEHLSAKHLNSLDAIENTVRELQEKEC